MKIIRWTRLAFMVLLLWMLCGCRGISRPEQPMRAGWFELSGEKTVGQTFTANFDGLNGIQVYLRLEDPAPSDLQLTLKSTPLDQAALAVSTPAASTIPSEGYVHFELPALPDSARQDYYFELETTHESRISLGTSTPEVYLDGAMYVDGEPAEAQLTFLLDYAPLPLALGLGRELLRWLGQLLKTGFLFILPGWGLLSALWSGWKSVRWPVRLGLSGGASLAVYPLVFLWSNVLGLHLGAVYAWLPGIAGLGLLLWSYRQERPIYRWRNLKPHLTLYDVLFILIIGLIIFSRFWSIRGLDLPMWGDGYQHTMIVQLMLDQGGLFQSWQPYSELSTFTYHYGFHAAGAVLAWLTGMPAAQAVLWSGQILNVLAVLAVLPLADKIGRHPWAALLAAAIAGLLLNMPSFYVNWARYTQLTGQVILPVAVFFAWLLLEQRRTDWKLVAISGLLAAGLALTHYRIVIFAILFLPAYWILQVRKANLALSLKSTLIYGLGTGALTLPWLINLARGRIPAIFGNQVTTSTQSLSTWSQTYNAIGVLDAYLPYSVWIGLFLAIAWLLWRRNLSAAVFALWWCLNLIITNPAWLGLPGTGTISNFTLFISAYIPASILIAAAMTSANWREQATSTSKFVKNNFAVVALILLLLVCLWGALQRSRDVDPAKYALALRPDLRAASWISTHTQEAARFLVNAFTSFGGSSLVGSDGGWWLPLTASRQTFLSPLTASFEQKNEETRATNLKIVDSIQEFGVDAPQTLQLMEENGLTHIYIGQQQGLVNTSSALLEVEDLTRSPHFSEVYHQDRVWIFVINYDNSQ